eukprot:362769-Chlamydomonas_euryale.AAC.2
MPVITRHPELMYCHRDCERDKTCRPAPQLVAVLVDAACRPTAPPVMGRIVDASSWSQPIHGSTDPTISTGLKARGKYNPVKHPRAIHRARQVASPPQGNKAALPVPNV